MSKTITIRVTEEDIKVGQVYRFKGEPHLGRAATCPVALALARMFDLPLSQVAVYGPEGKVKDRKFLLSRRAQDWIDNADSALRERRRRAAQNLKPVVPIVFRARWA
jgi:hypothetical protein